MRVVMTPEMHSHGFFRVLLAMSPRQYQALIRPRPFYGQIRHESSTTATVKSLEGLRALQQQAAGDGQWRYHR